MPGTKGEPGSDGLAGVDGIPGLKGDNGQPGPPGKEVRCQQMSVSTHDVTLTIVTRGSQARRAREAARVTRAPPGRQVWMPRAPLGLTVSLMWSLMCSCHVMSCHYMSCPQVCQSPAAAGAPVPSSAQTLTSPSPPATTSRTSLARAVSVVFTVFDANNQCRLILSTVFP